MNEKDLIPHLFKTEYSKIVSVLTRSFGLEYIEIAEDITSETFLSALNSWSYKGVPENPTGWLYTVAKNKLKNHLVRNKTFRNKVSEQLRDVSQTEEIRIDFSTKNISDSQLHMFFALCHPSISTEAQICLALRILCGLGLDEIADSFLSNKETIHKRLQRAKEKLRLSGITLEIPDADEINERLAAVLHTIYLLFSEGYYSESNNSIIRKELCVEALNLAYLLVENPISNTGDTNALLSLMCFHTSRIEARQTENGSIVLYDDQDKNRWDTAFIEKGFYYLQQASKWQTTSAYYVEASIAYWHTVDNNNTDKWTSILTLYDVLLSVQPSPVAALNRIWAFSKVHGNKAALAEIQKMDVQANNFYFILLAELYKDSDVEATRMYLIKAHACCKTDTEKRMIEKKLNALR